jgi:hypothetical protein
MLGERQWNRYFLTTLRRNPVNDLILVFYSLQDCEITSLLFKSLDLWNFVLMSFECAHL